MNCKLIAITGLDGTGKTTQIAQLAMELERTAACKVAAATIWDVFLDPKTKSRVMFRDHDEVDRYAEALHPNARALFLFHALAQSLGQAQQRGVDTILFDAYWYKYFATEVAHGGERTLLRGLADALFPKPDLTLYLRVDLEQAFDRKRSVSGYECGFASPRSKEAFVAFQRGAQVVMNELAEELGWIELDARGSVDAIHAHISKQLPAASGSTRGAGC